MDIIKNEITVILSVWKRDHLNKQLGSIVNQSKKPYQIWIYQNESHFNINIPEEIKREHKISVIQSKDIMSQYLMTIQSPVIDGLKTV